MLQRRTTAKPSRNQRWRAVARELLQTACNFSNNVTPVRNFAQRVAKRFGDLLRACECIVHHETPIHYKGDPQRSLTWHVGA